MDKNKNSEEAKGWLAFGAAWMIASFPEIAAKYKAQEIEDRLRQGAERVRQWLEK